MGLDEQIEQLAFGKSTPAMSACLGIYLSAEAVFVAESRISGGKPVVDHLVRVPLPPGPGGKDTKGTGVLNTDLLADTDRVVGVVSQAMSQIRWGSKFAVVSLSHHFGILRFFTMPAVERRFWRMAIPAEAKKYIPIPFEGLSNDYQVMPLPPGPDKRGRLGVLFGVTQTKTIENVKAIVEKLKLDLVGLELSACSVERLWDRVEPEREPYAQVHFDGGSVHIVLSERNIPIFVREVNLGAEAKVLDRRKVDINGCMDFTKKQLGAARPSKIRVSGTTPELAGWKEAFAQDGGLPVALQDTAKLLGLKAGEWGGYAAVGAATRHLGATPLTLDLAGSGKADDTDRRVAFAVLKSSAAIAAVLTAIGLFNNYQLMTKRSQLAALQAQGATLESFQGKTADEIQVMIDSMQKRSDSLSAVSVGATKITKIMEYLTEAIPDSVWIGTLDYTNPLDASLGGPEGSAGGAQSRRGLLVLGSAMGPASAVEQDLALQFKANLRKDTRFLALFGTIEMSVSGNEEGDKRPEGAESLGGRAQSVEGRTTFNMSCQGTGKPNG